LVDPEEFDVQEAIVEEVDESESEEEEPENAEEDTWDQLATRLPTQSKIEV